MKKVDRNEILPIGEYETIREHFRSRVIQEKRARRVQLSNILSVTFENHDTVLLQIQEMLRTERITSEDGIRHEIDTYNELCPNDGELSITLFVEIPDKEERDRRLVELFGLENHIALEIDGETSPAFGKRLGDDMGRTTAVHYLKFSLSQRAREAFISLKAKVSLVVNHAAHTSRVDLGAETIRSLASDLR
jgi:hypothetical protein